MTQTPTLEVGAKAPDFSLPLSGGETRTLSDYAGRRLVLYFYPKDDTPGCTNEAKDFSEHASAFAAKDTEILGVSKDTVAKHARFADKHNLSVPLGSDAEGTVCEDYGVWVEKKMYGKTYMGIERTTVLIGPDGHVEEVWRKVKVKGHAQAVFERIP
ncbi:MAG: thioredoxin-dependent thiol peroxidase [Pseudomonadota bacterium]